MRSLRFRQGTRKWKRTHKTFAWVKENLGTYGLSNRHYK